METFLYILLLMAALFILYAFLKPDKFQSKEERRLSDSLSNRYIYDPETGAKITLEQAESGIWLLPDEQSAEKNLEEQKRFYTEDELETSEFLEELRALGYTPMEFSDEQIDILNGSYMFSKYSDWSYGHPHINSAGTQVFFCETGIRPLKGRAHHNFGYQLAVWTTVPDYDGRYYFCEKTAVEELLDKLCNDDLIKTENYESFVIKRAYNIIPIVRIMEKFDNEPGLEVEIHGKNLLIKTMRFPIIEDLKRINKVLTAI